MSSDDAWIGDAQPYLAARKRGEADAWSAEAAARGRQGSQQLLAVEEVEAPSAVREFLRVPQGELAVVRRRLILLDGKPVELADSYYPAHVARDTQLAASTKIRGGAVTLLAALGFTPEDEPLEDVAAAIATPGQCEALGLRPGTPVLVLTRFTRSAAGEPIEVSIMTMTRNLRYRQRKEAS
ncbi:UTRA domain-containing protein [Streptomyces jumonjinensis]|uniref:UTRA domain-containing protein n=1 Tax=Streptomyces jumonjinensis TaxID=1945 RepID=A0A646KPA0_STRJU|nr:UTRA domain-containing protein [Streptomyces jumonjinensis]MQT02816.1 UTRA domain-containing protein [Streptomyces jumonjinensis]